MSETISLPSVIFGGSYHAALKVLAWNTAGWAAGQWGDNEYAAFGPPSIRRTIDLDILDLTGCIDAPLPPPPGEGETP